MSVEASGMLVSTSFVAEGLLMTGDRVGACVEGVLVGTAVTSNGSYPALRQSGKNNS